MEEDYLRSLLVSLKQNCEPSFNCIYNYYAKPLYKKVYSIIKDEAKSEEIIQDLFIKVWQKREEIDPDRSFKSFVYTIASNLAYDYLRKVACDKRLTSQLLLNATDCYLHVEEDMNLKEAELKLKEAINNLPYQQKQVFTLCKLEGKSYDETGMILGIATSTVNSHMVKSSRHVKAYLQKHLDLTIALLLFFYRY
jgi:RNA polymerase sigma-70 factor (ECF subfamily)